MSRLFAGTPFDQPKPCKTCGKLPAQCRCLDLPEKKKTSGKGGASTKLDSGLVLTPENSTPPKDQVAAIKTEKRKGARLVTVVTGLDHPGNDLAKLCTDLKQALSVGGSVQGRTIELQGDHAAFVETFFGERGVKTRRL
jgi:translation initiation factor 1 (eIF-1/SUI1)